MLFKICFAQNANVIIQVNGKLIIDGIAGLYLMCDSCKSTKKTSVGYVPGNLIFSKEAWSMINSSYKVTFRFDYYTYLNGKPKIANFFVELNKNLLNQQYLIINIYDFRDKKYKKWYQGSTSNKDFLAELIYPNSGVYIRNN
jgi:hypothetical protein